MTAWLPSRSVQLYASCCLELCKLGVNTLIKFVLSVNVSVKKSMRWRSITLFFLRGVLLLSFLTILSPLDVFANNVSVENVELVDLSESADTIVIEFDLSWSNAWKDSTNNDATWVFAKYCTANCTTNGTWSHALLKSSGTNPSGFSDGTKQSGSAFSSMDLTVPSDRVGVFVAPGHNGSGAVDFHDMQFVWDYGANGVDDADADASTTYVRVYAIEMTLMAAGSFWIGDGNSGTNGEFEWEAGEPGPVDSSENIEFDPAIGAADSFYYNTDPGSDDDASGTAITLGESFPTGTSATYLMKYELSQGQYRDFLNTLTQAQQDTRVASTLTNENDANTYVMIAEAQATVVSRQAIKAGSNPSDGDPYTFTVDLDDDDTGNESNDGEWIAMNYLSWMDLAAYADWAGLRPMSELEFEKACRGTNYPVIDEYCWGDTNITDADTISNSGQAGEGVSETGNGLVNYQNDGVSGPLRSGFAATGSTSTRVPTGAGFWGNMDLSGNLWERAATVGNAAGRNFAGSNGDGTLSTSGNANNADWPGYSSGEVTGAAGAGSRGGSWDETDTNYFEVSNRQNAGVTDATRVADSGGRLARTAP